MKRFVCCKCGDHLDFDVYVYEGKIYCRHCLKDLLGVEETIDVQYHYPDGLEMFESDLDELFMEAGAKVLFSTHPKR